jgi:hypothetical protein
MKKLSTIFSTSEKAQESAIVATVLALIVTFCVMF